MYREERRLVEGQYPGLTLCRSLLASGILAYHGQIAVQGSGGSTSYAVLLLYPPLFPYRAPGLFPLAALPEGEPHPGWPLNPVIMSARHQMSDGNLCLVEPDPFSEKPSIVRGVDVLRRARAWFFGVKTGHNPYDSLEADLQSHLRRSGDILIGPEFYSSELRQGGYFYAALLPREASPLARFIALAYSSDADVVARFKDCRSSLEKPFPWIQQKYWDTAQQLAKGTEEFQDALREGSVIRGRWWDLKKEPLPPRTGADVVRIVSDPNDPTSVERTLDSFKGDIYSELPLFVGFRFPGRKAEYDWLFLAIRLSNGRENKGLILNKEAKLAMLEQSSVFGVHRHPLLPREISLRNSGRVPSNVSKTAVSLLGVGAVGSVIADLLAKAGVGTLKLYDQDTLQVGNVSRHICGVESFAEPKVRAVELKLIQHNPFAAISADLVDIASSFDAIDKVLSDANLAICSTANESLEAAINEVAVTKPQTVYYVRGMRGGTAGRIFRVIPGRDACRYCVSTRTNDPEFQWLRVPELEDTILSHECGNPVLAGSGIDLTLIATLASRIVLNDVGGAFGDENHWLWTSEAVTGHPVLDEPYKLIARRVAPVPDCPFCSDPPILTVRVPIAIHTMMEKQVMESAEKETGGVLIGYFTDDRIAVVVEASDAGPKAESSVNGFSRDVEYTQRWLEQRVTESEGKIEYIGEWHSHPSEDTRPSSIDTTSLTEIANSPNYLCRTPVMVIMGYAEGQVAKSSAYSFAPNRPFREIKYETPTSDDPTRAI